MFVVSRRFYLGVIIHVSPRKSVLLRPLSPAHFQIFSRYVVAVCQNSAAKTSEIKELSELRETLGLNGLLMGEALYQARNLVAGGEGRGGGKA